MSVAGMPAPKRGEGAERADKERAIKITINLAELPIGFQRTETLWIPLMIELKSKAVNNDEQLEMFRALQGQATEPAAKRPQVATMSMPTVPAATIDITGDEDKRRGSGKD